MSNLFKNNKHDTAQSPLANYSKINWKYLGKNEGFVILPGEFCKKNLNIEKLKNLNNRKKPEKDNCHLPQPLFS